jgi:hypothetical protein
MPSSIRGVRHTEGIEMGIEVGRRVEVWEMIAGELAGLELGRGTVSLTESRGLTTCDPGLA